MDCDLKAAVQHQDFQQGRQDSEKDKHSLVFSHVIVSGGIRCTLNKLVFGLKTSPAQSGWGNVFEQTRWNLLL